MRTFLTILLFTLPLLAPVWPQAGCVEGCECVAHEAEMQLAQDLQSANETQDEAGCCEKSRGHQLGAKANQAEFGPAQCHCKPELSANGAFLETQQQFDFTPQAPSPVEKPDIAERPPTQAPVFKAFAPSPTAPRGAALRLQLCVWRA